MQSEAEANVFPGTGGHAAKRRGLWVMAAVAFAAAAIGFASVVFGDAGQLALHLSVTMPTILGVFAVIGALALRRVCTAVVVDEAGLRVEWGEQSEAFAWRDLAWSRVDATLAQTGRVLRLYGTDGSVVARIGETIDDFDRLIDLIRKRLEDQPDVVSELIRQQQGRRQALLLIGLGLVFALVAAANAAMTYRDQADASRFLAEAEMTQGTVLRKFVAPNGVTKRLEYEVTNAAGVSAVHNAEVHPVAWEMFPDSGPIEVMSVPDDPGIAHLPAGEIMDNDLLTQPEISYALSAGVGLMALIGLVAGVLSWFGWDIDFDTKTKKFCLKPVGQGS